MAEAARRAEERAADGLYDAYADRLNDYAYSLVHETDAAADAVHAAIVTAHGRADLLRETSRLRAWLYALTRFHAGESRVQGGDRRGRTPAYGFAGGRPHEHDQDVEDPELTAVVREALGELGQRERDVLLLAVRHGLTTAEIGVVLGLTSRQAGNRLGRAREQLDNAGAAVILARTGRAHCPDLSALVDSLEGPFPQPLRRRLTRHIGGCEECTDGRRRRVTSERLLDAVPVAFPPLSLRRRVAETCSGIGDDAERAAVLAATERFDKNGFPPPGTDRRARGDRTGLGRRTKADRTAADPARQPTGPDAARHATGPDTARHATGPDTVRYPAGTAIVRYTAGTNGAVASGANGRHATGTTHGYEDANGAGAAGAEDRYDAGTQHRSGGARRGSSGGAKHGSSGYAGGTEHGFSGGADGAGSGHEWETEPAAGPDGGQATAPRGRGRRDRRAVRAGVRKGRRTTPVFAAVACVLLATGAMVVATGQDATPPGTQMLRFPSRTPGDLQITYPDPTGPAPSASRSSPGRSPAASPTPSQEAAFPAGPTDRPRPSATRSPSRSAPAQPAARLVLSCPGALGQEGGGVILISARNAALEWSAAASGGLSVSPGRGVLGVGVKARLAVVVAEPGESGEGLVTFRSAAGEAACAVSWDGQEQPPESEPPPDPTSPPDPVPTDAPSGDATGDPS
ncbi:sigma-70 family RNA polymerase sigma factor [Sphaerisporangium aureirubrum]|uniref:Sigma-70 family RNA polymerase sigma factor n=1 Tax=Sphaerisporangium aureirubrum TaxID=1544736 RepID=A0ABW1NNZ2_9ACTN